MAATLAGLGGGEAPARIRAASRPYYHLVDQLSQLVVGNHSREAALKLGASQRPGGADARLSTELARANAGYGAAAGRSRAIASIETFGVILFLLVAFSAVFLHSVRSSRRHQREAKTDALTGLGNRRKLFADMEPAGGDLGGRDPAVVGIFDLDGFKAYNDTFGHPAGDDLLTRLEAGSRQPSAAVGVRTGSAGMSSL